MANDIKTNRRAELVLIRSAEAAPYLTVGSKNYCKDQLVGKRNGQSYEFVIRDAGEYVEGMDISNVGSEDVIERKVTKNIKIGNVKVNTNLLEKVTDLNWDKEIAEPYGEKVAKGLVQSVLADDIGLQNTAFVGTGWLPLFKASNYLESISSESQYAFVDPMVESIMQSSGRGFTPAGDVEPRFQKGLKGMVGQAEVRAQQGMPTLEISEDLAAELASATVTSYATGTDYDTLTLNGVTEDIPAGTPLFIAGVYATDMVGVKTSALKAFIAIEDATSGSVKVRKTDFVGNGTREACDIDGDNIVLSELASKKLANPIKAGIYFTGIFRVNGAMEFDALPELDWSNAESRVTSPDGITLHEGRAVDVLGGTNKTRWAIAAVAGIVEPRGCAYVCIKDNTANLIAQ
ncbi:MAG: hypothetical protein IKG84_06920 [Bacteroidales bacterium]|nr:hypothetical protein [Bacteroidales bacterium]